MGRRGRLVNLLPNGTPKLVKASMGGWPTANSTFAQDEPAVRALTRRRESVGQTPRRGKALERAPPLTAGATAVCGLMRMMRPIGRAEGSQGVRQSG
jgi:hypothetical protein